MIRHVVSPLTQLVDDQADITDGKELIPFTMGNIHGQLARLGTALMRSQYPSYHRESAKTLRPGKADFIAERTAIRQPREENTVGVDVVACLDLVQDVEQGRGVPGKPGGTERFDADQEITTAFGVLQPRPDKILVVAATTVQRQQQGPGLVGTIVLWHITGIRPTRSLSIVALDATTRSNVRSGRLAGFQVGVLQQPVVHHSRQMMTHWVQLILHLCDQTVG